MLLRPRWEIDIKRIDILSARVEEEHLRSVGSYITPTTQRPAELTQVFETEKVFGMGIAHHQAANHGIMVALAVLNILQIAAVGRPVFPSNVLVRDPLGPSWPNGALFRCLAAGSWSVPSFGPHASEDWPETMNDSTPHSKACTY